jgi:hypothetical protein
MIGSSAMAEAIITGSGAAILLLAVGTIVARIRARKAVVG